MQSPLILSRFPDLTGAKRETGHAQVEDDLVVQLPCARLPIEILLLSWARLLRAYTDDDAPVFLLDDQTVQADLGTGNLERRLTGGLAEHVAYSVINTTEVTCYAVKDMAGLC